MDSASENEDLGASFLSDSASQFLVTDEDSRDEDDEGMGTGVLREQDRFLPIANVARLMKKAIPKTGKIAKDARECVQECVSEFVSFITSEASDRCHQEKRKTINGEDILYAMQTLGFDNYIEPLKLYLQKYRESMKGEKGATLGVAGETLNLSEGTFMLISNGDELESSGTSSSTGKQNLIFYTQSIPPSSNGKTNESTSHHSSLEDSITGL